jgi:hypothetical protein
MSYLSEPALANLVSCLAQKFAIRQFIETGTSGGDGAAWAAKVFPSVTTVEINGEFRQAAMRKYGHLSSITFLLGDSIKVLPQVVPGLKGPAFFWIDAHCGGGNFGPEDYCPLLKELEIIATSPHPHFIFIDDARAFVAPPPPPFNADCWPQLADVLAAARAKHPYYCVVIHDIVMCVPLEARPEIISFCNNVRPSIDARADSLLQRAANRLGLRG